MVFKRAMIALFAAPALFACGCGSDSGKTGKKVNQITDVPETDAPIVLSPEMQEKLGHYISEEWKCGMDKITSNFSSDFMFAIQSDTHFSVNNKDHHANNLKALSHFIPLKFYANLGDYIKGYFKNEIGRIENTPDKTMQSLKELTSRYLEDANCPVLVTFGNHDTNQLWCKNYGRADEQLTKDDHYREVISKLRVHNGSMMTTDKESNYYYADFPDDGIRVIMLNCADGNYENSYDSTAMFSDRQVEWFKNEALNTASHVLIMTHVPLIKDFPGNDGCDVKNGILVRAAVEEFIKNGGKFIAYFNGHTHNQADLTDENGRLHISFKNGAHIAEVVKINTKKRVIETVGLGNVENRKYIY